MVDTFAVDSKVNLGGGSEAQNSCYYLPVPTRASRRDCGELQSEGAAGCRTLAPFSMGESWLYRPALKCI